MCVYIENFLNEMKMLFKSVKKFIQLTESLSEDKYDRL